MVSNLVQHVYVQLQDDDSRVARHPESHSARNYLNESLEYLKLLNQWLNQESIATEQAVREQVAVSTSPTHPLQAGECLHTNNAFYIRIKSIRESIYGCVEMYQVAVKNPADGQLSLTYPPQYVAIKAFNKERVLQRESRTGCAVQEDPIRELAIQQRLSTPGHPNVIPVLSIMETEHNLYAVYPFIRQDMFDYVSECKRVPEAEAKRLFRSMVSAINYCQKMGVCHRDISLENFLMREVEINGQVQLEPVLIDFGLSVVLRPNPNSPTGEYKLIPHTGAVGKEFYMAPEVFYNSGIPYDGPKTDVWSLGVCLGIMLTGFPLWTCPSNADERFRVLVLQHRLPDVLTEWKFNFSPECVLLLQRMLEFDTEVRLSIDQVLADAWMTMA
jgi:serine/threonine protein kinase